MTFYPVTHLDVGQRIHRRHRFSAVSNFCLCQNGHFSLWHHAAFSEN